MAQPAIAHASASVDAISSIARLTSSNGAPDEVFTKVSSLSDSVTELRRAEKKLMLEIAKYESEQVKEVVRGGENAWVYRTDGGMDFINKVIGETKETVEGTGLVVVFAMGEVKKSGPVIIVGDKEAVGIMAGNVR